MTQDEIIWQNEVLEMARQAGMGFNQSLAEFSTPLCDGVEIDELQAFAKLVEARTAEREREACAKAIDEVGMFHEVSQGADLCFDLSKAIRARGEAK